MGIDADKKTLTVQNIRNVNKVNILQTLIRDRQKMRSDLAVENHISVMTVKHIVDELVEAGIVSEKTCSGAEVGRKPKALEIAKEYGTIICINLTLANEISFLIYDIYENLIDKQVLCMCAELDYYHNLLSVIKKINEILLSLPTKLVGIAVFVPSAYYEDVDLVNYDLIPDFKELHIKALFEKEFEIKNILILHDVFPAARSEYDSLNPTLESQFYFYCGHGVGGFFIHKDEAVMGNELMAGEVGKMLLPIGNGSKKFITFEEVVSISAVKRKMEEKGVNKNFHEIIEAYEAGDALAKEILDPVLDEVARVLYNLLWVYNPNCLVIDSCSKKYGALIVERFKKFMKVLKNEAIPIHVKVRQAKYDEYHMMRGCFHMVRDAWIEEIAVSRKSIE